MFTSAIRGQESSAASASKALGTTAAQALNQCNLGESARTQGYLFGTSLKNGISGQSQQVSSVAKSIGNAAKNALNDLSTSGYTIGTQFSSGLARGIRAGEYGVSSAAAAVANAAAKAAKKNLDIHSPSKVGGYIGEMFDKGIELNMLKNSGRIEKAANKVTDLMKINPRELIDSMRGAFSTNITRLTNEKTSRDINNIVNIPEQETAEVKQTINIYQPVKSPVEVSRVMKKEARRLAINGR